MMDLCHKSWQRSKANTVEQRRSFNRWYWNNWTSFFEKMNLNTDVIFFMCMLNHYSHVQTFGTQWSSPSGSPVHSVQEARTLEWVTNAFLQGIFLTQGLKPCFLSLLHCQVGSLPLAPPGSPLHLLQKINSKSITDLHISHKII